MKFKTQLILSTGFYKYEGQPLGQTFSWNIDNARYPNEIQVTANPFCKFYKLEGHQLGQTLSRNIDNARHPNEIQGKPNCSANFYK